jgi:hypothetical protein
MAFGAENPRVRYLLGMCQFHTAEKPAAYRETLATLQAADQLYTAEAQRPCGPVEPRWGHGSCLTVLKERGYTFDIGPSILTLPHLFERLFARSGRKLSDYIPLRALRPHWRNFFEDGRSWTCIPSPTGWPKRRARSAKTPPTCSDS